jgi:hypothetical protein
MESHPQGLCTRKYSRIQNNGKLETLLTCSLFGSGMPYLCRSWAGCKVSTPMMHLEDVLYTCFSSKFWSLDPGPCFHPGPSSTADARGCLDKWLPLPRTMGVIRVLASQPRSGIE